MTFHVTRDSRHPRGIRLIDAEISDAQTGCISPEARQKIVASGRSVEINTHDAGWRITGKPACDVDWGSATADQRCTRPYDHGGVHIDAHCREWGYVIRPGDELAF